MGVTIARLENGLTIYVSTDRTKPEITTRILVRAGSRHDPADSTGLAHYLEHMLFKGTNKLGALDPAAEAKNLATIERLYAERFVEKDEGKRTALMAEIDRETQASAGLTVPREIDRVYAALGITRVNALTDKDFTVYVANVPSNHFEPWIKVEAERLQHPNFRQFLNELEAVYEESNRNQDDTERRMYEALLATVFPHHPYGSQLNGGSSEHLKNPAYAHMVEFFRRWYVPNNTAIILSGDIDAATAVPIIRAHFGNWEPRALPAELPGEIAPLRGRKQVEIFAEGEESVMLAWPTVAATHADFDALQLMNLVMSMPAGILQNDLILPQKVLGASTDIDNRVEAGVFVASASAKDGQSVEELERLLLASVAHLKEGRFADDDIDALIFNLAQVEKHRMEVNEGRAGWMVTAFCNREPWQRYANILERFRRIKKADVVRVANRYLTSDFVAVQRKRGKFTPQKIAKPNITPLPPSPERKSEFAREIAAMPTKPLEPQWVQEGVHYQRRKLPAGKLLASRNVRNDLFELSYQYEVGSRRHPLLCFAATLQTTSGAGDLDSKALQKRLFAMGASVSVDCGPDYFNIGVSGVDSKMVETLALLDQWFRKPRFDADDVAKLIDRELTARRQTMEDPRGVAGALAAYSSFGPQSGYLLAPPNATLLEATPAELAQLLADLPDHTHKTHYFGPRAVDDAAKVIGFGTRHRPLPRRPAFGYRQVNRDTIYFVSRDLAQAQVEVTFPFGRLTRKDQGAAKLLDEYLGGSTETVLYEIRERRSLAYSASAGVSWGSRPVDQGALTGFLASQPDKANQALERLVEILRKDKINPARLDDSKRAIEERYRGTRVDPRAVTGAVDSWDELGEKGDIRPRLRAEVKKLEPRDIEAFLRRLAKTPMVVSLTADEGRITRQDLGKVGKLVEPQLSELFNYGAFPKVKSDDAPSVSARK
jgi:predicted Zn-dependent peptidase